VKVPLRELIRFGSVGVASNVIYLAVLVGLRALELPWWLSTGLAYAASMVANYLLQRSVTFKSQRNHQAAGPRYLLVMGTCLVINSAMMETLVAQMGVHPVIAQIGTLVFTTALSYVGQKFWAFRAEPGASA
jgi:putative flippase GtrA